MSLRSSYESCGWCLPVLLRGASLYVWLWWQHFVFPEHFERHAVLARLIRSRQSHWRIHGRCELDLLWSAECRNHGSIGDRSKPGCFCHQCLTDGLLPRQVMAFFLSDTTAVGTTSDEFMTTSATAAGDAVTFYSPTVQAIYVSGVAELTVELRPADEEYQLQCLCAQLKTRLHRLIF